MQLIYLYIENYKNIQNQGFNFTTEFKCDYKDGTLTIDKNENYIENFFGGNIEVSAIVGENGSGKSNLLNLLFNEHFMTNVFFILKNHNELKIYGADLDSIKYPNNTIREEQLVDKIFSCTNLSLGKLNSHKLAFYTPLLQNTFTDNQHNHVDTKYNLSPASLLDDYKSGDQVYKDISFKNLYGIYESNDIQNAIGMIKNCRNINIPFDVPEELTIRVNIIADYEEFLPHYEFLKDKKRNDDSFYSYMEQRIIKNWFANSFEDFYSKNNEDENRSLLEPIKENFGEFYSIDTLISILPQTISMSGINASIDFLHDQLKEINNFLEEIKKIANAQTGNSLRLNIDKIANDFILKYNKVVESCSAFLDFDWNPKLSSGQQTFLSQFSLFYKHLNNNDKTFLFIDEGETTLHPNWQKMYIKYIVDFFQKNMKNKKIHIIFSSHSPFILSDIPRQNIVFLKDGKQVDALEKKQTFGANIHTLLADGFFMDGGLMGEFAKEKIEEVIKFLNDDKSKIKDKKEAQKIINIIGEPFLKQKLQDMYFKKFNDNSVDEQIKKLERQIERLKNVKS